jgi:integrase
MVEMVKTVEREKKRKMSQVSTSQVSPKSQENDSHVSNVSKLDKKVIDKLKPPIQGQTFLWDSVVPGFGIRVTQNGIKSFILQYRNSAGKSRRYTIGRFGSFTVDKARKQALKLHAGVANGEDPAEERKKKRKEGREGTTFEKFSKNYLNNYDAKNKTTKENERKIDNIIKPKIGKKRVSEIDRKDILEIVHSMKEKPYLANRTLALLSSMFNYAEDIELRPRNSNPCKGIKKFPETSRERFIQPDELPKFFEALAKEDQLYQDFFKMCLMTGARKSNVLTMEWKEINWEWKVWSIPEEKTKTRERYNIPLSPEAIDILKERKKEKKGPWVFPATRGNGPLADPRKAWERILDAAEINDLRIHDLRRTLGSWQAATGSTTAVIGKTLHHKKPTTTQVYERLNLDPVRNSVEKATGAMLDVVKKKQEEEEKKAKAKEREIVNKTSE